MLQALVREQVEFFWALIDYNPTALSCLPSLNIEDPSAPSFGDPRDWPAILVSCSAAEIAVCGTILYTPGWLANGGVMAFPREDMLPLLYMVWDRLI